MISLLVIGAIVAAIVLGYLTRINIGLFSIAFAYLIGCFCLGMSPKEVIHTWPLDIFFIIFSVCLFYGFAMVNGLLERLADILLYMCRHRPRLMPFAVFSAALLIAGLGAGYYTVLAFMAPIALLMSKRTGLDRVIAAMAVNYGALAGANFMSSQSGIIFRTLMTGSGISADDAFLNSVAIFVSTLIIPIVVISLFTLTAGKTINTAELAEMTPPRPLDRRQKITLLLMLLMMLAVLLPPITQLLMPENDVVHAIDEKINIGLIASVFAVIALLLKLGDERKVIASVPWSTLIMICGVGMLIAVGIKAGTLDILTRFIGEDIPVWLVPLAFVVVAAIMSIFASTLGVVTPTLFPIVPPIAHDLGIDLVILFCCIVVGAQATSISPFASGGSLILGASGDEDTRTEMMPKLLFKAAPIGIVAALLFNLAFTLVW